MYNPGMPIAGGTAVGGALASTGVDTFGLTVAALALVIGGLFALRSRMIRRTATAEE